jgi:hypothetical protein
MRDSIRGEGLATVPGAGHSPDFGEPEAVAAVEGLLKRVLKAGW